MCLPFIDKFMAKKTLRKFVSALCDKQNPILCVTRSWNFSNVIQLFICSLELAVLSNNTKKTWANGLRCTWKFPFPHSESVHVFLLRDQIPVRHSAQGAEGAKEHNRGRKWERLSLSAFIARTSHKSKNRNIAMINIKILLNYQYVLPRNCVRYAYKY